MRLLSPSSSSQRTFEHTAAVKFGSPHAFLPLHFVISSSGTGIFLLQVSTLDSNLHPGVFKKCLLFSCNVYLFRVSAESETENTLGVFRI